MSLNHELDKFHEDEPRPKRRRSNQSDLDLKDADDIHSLVKEIVEVVVKSSSESTPSVSPAKELVDEKSLSLSNHRSSPNGGCKEEVTDKVCEAPESDDDIIIVAEIPASSKVEQFIKVEPHSECSDMEEMKRLYFALRDLYPGICIDLGDRHASVTVGNIKYTCSVEGNNVSISENYIPLYSIFRRLVFDKFQDFPMGLGNTWTDDFHALLELKNTDRISKFNPPLNDLLINRVEKFYLDRSMANKIGNAVHSKLIEILPSRNDPSKDTVFSGIVLTDENNPEWHQVVCVTTGTKVIRAQNMETNGKTVHDFHAEILAKRCFRLFLYRQIEKYHDGNRSLLEKSDRSNKLRIKKGIKVNLFISTAPCGDARVFTVEEKECDEKGNCPSRGLLRFKSERLEGDSRFCTYPVRKDVRESNTFHFLKNGRLATFMTCSDKVAMWNVVGIQGALLSHFVESVYLESVVLAHTFNPEHLLRAVYFRIFMNAQKLYTGKLPNGYEVNKIKIGNSPDVKDRTTADFVCPQVSYNWVDIEGQNTEVIDYNKRNYSRLCKLNMFSRFRKVLEIPGSSKDNPVVSYLDSKLLAISYQQAKVWFKKAMVKQDLRSWIRSPREVDKFEFDRNSYKKWEETLRAQQAVILEIQKSRYRCSR